MPHHGYVDETPRERLSRLMDERRRFLRKTWEQVAADASITYETIRQIRSGAGDIRPLTKRGIEEALGWLPGSVDGVLAGDEPHIVPASRIVEHTFYGSIDPVEQLVRDIYNDPDMPEERKHTLVRLIRQAEAQRDAELRAAQDELTAWRNRRAAG